MTTFGLFILSHKCSSGLVCKTCRAETPEGEAWRHAMGRSYDMTGACPRGLPMGWDGTAEPPSKRVRPAFDQGFDRTPRPPRLPGCGDHLEAIILERGYDVPDPEKCGCGELKAKMNRWGPGGCCERMGEIIDALIENAAELGGWRGWAARRQLARRAVAAAARGMVDEAIKRTVAQRPIDPASNGL